MTSNKSKYEKGLLGKILQFDKSLSLALSLSASKKSPLGKYRSHMKTLEYSCHGVFWICGSIILLWLSEDPRKEAFFFNIILALFLDILFVSILKASLRRKRPENNESEDMFLTVSIDKMSCPSGHTSRAVLLTYLLISCTPGMSVFHLLIIVWCISTSTSRVLLGRHHVGDVMIGAMLGYFEYCIMDHLWAGPETAKWYLDLFRDSNSIVEDL